MTNDLQILKLYYNTAIEEYNLRNLSSYAHHYLLSYHILVVYNGLKRLLRVY